VSIVREAHSVEKVPQTKARKRKRRVARYRTTLEGLDADLFA